MHIAAGFLAGGLARRMGGGDKAELRLAGRSLLSWQLDATDHIPTRIINANGDLNRFSEYKLPVVSDVLDGHLGPLAGIHAMLRYLQNEHKDITHLMSLATDAPFVPKTLSENLAVKLVRADADIAIASSAGRHHPVFALWPTALCAELEAAISGEGLRKIDDFTSRYKTTHVAFDGEPDPFMNINRPEDLKSAESIAKAL